MSFESKTTEGRRSTKVSICIPTYNQAQYLTIAIRSALDQDYDNLEIVVSDNHCTDETSEALARLSDPRLRIVRPVQHLDLSQHLEFCIAASTGDYFTVLCSDDVLLPGYVGRIAGALDEHPSAALAYCAARIIDEDGRTRYVERHVGGSFFRNGRAETKRFLSGTGCVFPTQMFRRTSYVQAGGFLSSCADAVNDWDLQLRLITVGDIAYEDEVLACFRVWSTPERAGRVVTHLAAVVKLYETTISKAVSSDPDLRRAADRARHRRAVNSAANLSRIQDKAEFELAAREVLRLGNTLLVQILLILHRLRLSGLVVAGQRLRLFLRGVVKESLISAHRAVNGARKWLVSHRAGRLRGCLPAAGHPRGRARRVASGVLANLLGQIINTSGHILLVPVSLAFWGSQLYGEWLTLSATVMYLSMIDFGMQMFVVNRLSQCYVHRDFVEQTRVLQSALLLTLGCTTLALCLAIPALLLSPLNSWFHFMLTSRSTASLVAILLCTQVLAAVPYGLITGIYRSIGEYSRGQMTNNVRVLASLIVTLGIVAGKGGLAIVASTQLLALAVVSWWVLGDLRSRHPEIHIGLGSADLKLASSFLGPSLLFFLIQAASAISVQGSVIIVGALFGAASVAIFVPLRTLANLTRQLCSIIHSALWPELTVLEAAGRYPELRNIHLVLAKLLVAISVSTALVLHFMGREVVMLWTHRNVSFDASLMDAFLMMVVAQSPWTMSALILASSNNHRRLAICNVFSAIIGLTLGFFAAHRFGMSGIVHGLWVTDFIICGCFIAWTACRLIDESLLRFLSQVLFRGAAFAFVLFIVARRLHELLPATPNILRIGLFAGQVYGAAVISGYTIFLSRQNRHQLKPFIRRVWPFREPAQSFQGS